MANALSIDLRKTTDPFTTVPGINLNYTGWTGIKPRYYGKDAVIRGHGKYSTTIDAGPNAISSIMVGDDSGVVTIRDCTIVVAQTYAIWYGSKRGDWKAGASGDPEWYEIRDQLYPDSMLRLRNVRIVTRQPEPGRSAAGKWAVSTTNVDHDWEDVEADVPHLAEHLLYKHGSAKYGIRWKRVRVISCGAEAMKIATRPWEAHFTPNAQAHIEDCDIGGWAFQNWGGGIVMQGPGLQNVRIERCLLRGGDKGKAACLRFDDGLSTIQNAENNLRRYYDINGIEGGPGACTGLVALKNVAFQGTNRETLRIGTIYPGYEKIGIPYHSIAERFFLTQSGAYGDNSKITLRDVKNVWMKGNNLPSIEAFVESQGFWTEHETTFNGVALSSL